MTGVAAEQELYRACRIIFGSDLTVSREFLEYIQFSGVKSAFRKKAMETHPDRLTGHDELAIKRSARMFHSVQQAYEKLMQYLEAREKGFRFHDSGPSSPGTFCPVRRSPFQTKPPRGKGPVAKNKFSAPAGMWQGKSRAGEFHHEGESQRTFYARDLYQGSIPERAAAVRALSLLCRAGQLAERYQGVNVAEGATAAAGENRQRTGLAQQRRNFSCFKGLYQLVPAFWPAGITGGVADQDSTSYAFIRAEAPA